MLTSMVCMRISDVFCLKPDFNDQPRNTDQEVVNWMKFYEMSAPLVCLGTMVTQVTVSEHSVAGGHHLSLSRSTTQLPRHWTISWSHRSRNVHMVSVESSAVTRPVNLSCSFLSHVSTRLSHDPGGQSELFVPVSTRLSRDPGGQSELFVPVSTKLSRDPGGQSELFVPVSCLHKAQP